MEPTSSTDWTPELAESKPRKAPAPCYAPFLLALGITMLFWGLTTSPVMSVGGLVVFVVALWIWIREIAQDWKN